MQSNISDSDMHIGHRERMRRKLMAYGGEIFDTYELLEMLLYNAFAVKDTKPIAKRLLATFGGIDEVLSADPKDLINVDGIGASTADYLVEVGKLPDVIAAGRNVGRRLLSNDDIGNFFIGYFNGKTDYAVSILLLDNAMRPIKMVDAYNCDYGSGSVHSKAFLDIALANRASAVAIGHNHPYGPLYPNRSDILTHKLVAEGFKHSGVDLLDHYLVSGNGYLCIGEMATKADGTDVLLRDFGIVCVKTNASAANPWDYRDYLVSDSDRSNRDREYLKTFFRRFISDEERCFKLASSLIDLYHDLDGVLCRSCEELFAICGPGAAALKVLAFITARRFTDKYGKGKKFGNWIKEYFRWKFFGISQENVYIALFDKNEKMISVNKLSEGTVNSSEILPRKAMEISLGAGAKYAVMAHNHPGGISISSHGDFYATSIISQALENVGVELRCHLIVAGAEVGSVNIPSVNSEKSNK